MKINRDSALAILHEHMQSPNLRRHCYGVEVVMATLARFFGEDEEKWGIVGLLHDGDYEETRAEPAQHTIKMARWLKDYGEDDVELVEAILSHNFTHTGQNPPKNSLEWSLYCCDELTGFIVAVALIRPNKKLAEVKVEDIVKKWNQKGFAAGVHRSQIEECESKLGIKLDKFIGLALGAMQSIAPDLGL